LSGNKETEALYKEKRRNLRITDDLINELKDVLGTLQMYEVWEDDPSTDPDTLAEIPSAEERRQMVADVFKRVGGRRTRRQAKRRKTQRKRKSGLRRKL
jgi:hypothetical protein